MTKRAFMARKQIVDELAKLVEETQKMAIKDSCAKRCWGLHKWTRFEPLRGAEYMWQTRECVQCGKIQDKRR